MQASPSPSVGGPSAVGILPNLKETAATRALHRRYATTQSLVVVLVTSSTKVLGLGSYDWDCNF